MQRKGAEGERYEGGAAGTARIGDAAAAQATAQQQQFAQQTVLIRTLQQTAQETNKKRKLDNENLKAYQKQCKSVVDKLTEENKRLTEEIKRLTEKVSERDIRTFMDDGLL